MSTKEIKTYLEQVTKLNNKCPCNWLYSSIEHLVLTLGREMELTLPLLPIKEGKMGQCFKNASTLAIERGWQYCEGFAFGIIPVLHAWCLFDGKVVDPTWQDPDSKYFGVTISQEVMHKIHLQRGKYGVLDSWDIGFPLLKGELLL